MRNNARKFVFFTLVLGVAVISAALHPSFFFSGGLSGGAIADGGGQGGDNSILAAPTTTMPQIVSPSVSAGGGDGMSDGTTSTVASSTRTKVPNVGAEVEFIADLTTGKTYLDVHGEERWPMASVSKLMTAVVASDLLQSTDRITVTESMLAADPSQRILNVGDTYPASDLLRIMLLPSNNVAAEALARFYGRPEFLAAMNAKAEAWGMASTYYDDPSGLSAANQSSGSDLLKLAQHLYADYPQILAITRTPQVNVQNLSTGQSVIIKSINNFAGDADFIGGKTGYTDQADGNLLSIFNDHGAPIFIVVLGIDDGVRFNATQQLYTWFQKNS